MATDAEFLRALASQGEGQDLGNEYSAKRMRLLEIAGRLPEDYSNFSPWDEKRAQGDDGGGWGPGSLEDYVKLSGQSDEPVSPEEAVDIFIRRNVPRCHQPHLLDSDSNDGEYLRRIVRGESGETATADAE